MGGPDKPASPCAGGDEADPDKIQLGDFVTAHGLSKAFLNGRLGKVNGYFPDKGRYAIDFALTGKDHEAGQLNIKEFAELRNFKSMTRALLKSIKTENLELRLDQEAAKAEWEPLKEVQRNEWIEFQTYKSSHAGKKWREEDERWAQLKKVGLGVAGVGLVLLAGYLLDRQYGWWAPTVEFVSSWYEWAMIYPRIGFGYIGAFFDYVLYYPKIGLQKFLDFLAWVFYYPGIWLEKFNAACGAAFAYVMYYPKIVAGYILHYPLIAWNFVRESLSAALSALFGLPSMVFAWINGLGKGNAIVEEVLEAGADIIEEAVDAAADHGEL